MTDRYGSSEEVEVLPVAHITSPLQVERELCPIQAPSTPPQMPPGYYEVPALGPTNRHTQDQKDGKVGIDTHTVPQPSTSKLLEEGYCSPSPQVNNEADGHESIMVYQMLQLR